MLPPGSSYVVRFMVLNSLGAALLASLAFVLQRLHVPEPILWRICSGAYVSAAAYFSVVSMRQERALRVGGAALFPPALGRGVWASVLLAHAVQLSNLIGFPAGPSEGVFLLGLWVLVFLAAAQFIALLFLALE